VPTPPHAAREESTPPSCLVVCMSRRAKKHPVPADPPLERRDRGLIDEGVTRHWPAALAVGCALVLATFFVFGQTLDHEFINYDDDIYVYHNQHVEHGFTAGWLGWALTSKQCSNWHPLTWFSHTLDGQLFGLSPGAHHATSVLLHAAGAVVLFLVLRRMTGDFWQSGFVAAVFAVHPLHVESVAWVAERKDVLSGLFFMLTLGAYLGYVRHGFSWVRYLAVVACFALGLTAKPMLVTLPFVLLLLDYWPLGRLGFGVPSNKTPIEETPSLRPSVWLVWVEKVPLLLLSAVSCVVTVWAQQNAIRPLEHLSLSTRAANAAVSYVAYLGKMFCPTDLAVIYPHQGTGLSTWQVATAAVVLVAITAAVVVLRRRCPYLLVGWFWYVGMLVPVIGLVQVGLQSMADRYTYLPQIGLCMAIAWGAAQLTRSWPHRGLVCGVVAALALGALMIVAREQAAYWHDSETLFTHALACTSPNSIAHCNLAGVLLDKAQTDRAVEEFEKALAVQPNPNPVKSLSNLGDALTRQGRYDDAIKRCEEALKLDPNYADAHYNLGHVLRLKGRLDEAIYHFREALRLQPGCADAYNNLGVALAQKRMFAEAIHQFRMALEVDPAWVDARRNLGMALTDNGQIAEALEQYRLALDFAMQQGNRALAETIKEKIRACPQAQPLR
jgi:protein O-mannosyl-transferase